MPTYEYACKSCGHQFEIMESITSKPLRKCPECGKLKLNRLIGSGAGVIFKGTGFYQTDYRSESYKSSQKKEKTDSSIAPAAASTKTPDKPKPPAEKQPPKSNK